MYNKLNKINLYLFNFQSRKFMYRNMQKYPLCNFAKKHKKGKDQNEQKPETINELEFDQYENDVNKIVEQFQQSLDFIKLGKITPQTFQSMSLMLQGQQTSLIDLGQIIPVNIQSVIFHPYDEHLKDDILKLLQKDQVNDFQILEEGNTIRISKQNTDTAEQRQKVLKMLKSKLQDKRKLINDARRNPHKYLKDNKTRMSDDLFRQGNQEVERITQDGFQKLERIFKEKENTFTN